MAEGRFALRPVRPYSFGASVRFLEGFAPAAYEGNEAGHLHVAFVADGGEDVAGVCVREEGGVILGEVSGEAEVEGWSRGRWSAYSRSTWMAGRSPRSGSGTLW